jgi:lipoate-protein ligase A
MGPAMKWRFLKHKDRPGAFHMAVDEALLDLVGRGQSPPTLRAYTWCPPAVSLGRSQRRSINLDQEKCARAGVDVIMRPSGGRAVLHDGDVTYAAVFPADGLFEDGGLRGTYLRLAAVLICAFRRLGVAADVSSTRDSCGGAALPCFTTAARDEILIAGRKLVGSAQRRTRDAVLQHGAILVKRDQMKLASLVTGEDESRALRSGLAGRTVGLEEVLGRPVTFEEVAAALVAGAEEVLNVTIADGVLTEEELLAAEGIMMGTRGGVA